MQVERLFDYINKQYDEKPLEKFTGARRDGDWSFFTTGQVIELSRKLASGLIDLGIIKGDKVGIVVYKNRPEWVITDLAIQYIGAIGIPMYPTISSREYEYIMNEAEVKVCFVGSGDLYDKVSAAQAKVNNNEPQAALQYLREMHYRASCGCGGWRSSTKDRLVFQICGQTTATSSELGSARSSMTSK